MEGVRKTAAHIDAVIKRILFIGFSIQIVLGLMWLCRNFVQVQDFGEPDSALYGWFFRLIGENSCVMYLLQLACAFFSGNCLLKQIGAENGLGKVSRRFFAVWGGFAMLTFPFALQCHLAIQPYSFMASLFMTMLTLLLGSFARQRKDVSSVGGWKRKIGYLVAAIFCAGFIIALSGVADKDKREEPGRSFEAAMASRFGWPTIWNDQEYWSEELRQMTETILWRTAYFPHNMKILQAELEAKAGKEGAKEYYLQIAGTGWKFHAGAVIRQIGWDALGYMVTPPVFQWQLKGNAYDSYTGRNYEIMRDHEPALTRYYVDYACWWFCWMLILSFLLTVLQVFLAEVKDWRRVIMSVICCLSVSGILTAVLVMRGAGVMDYRQTIAINELWLIWALLLMKRRGGKCQERE